MMTRSTKDSQKPTTTLARALLKKEDWRFLHVVFYGGGYFTRQQAVALKLRPSAPMTALRVRFLIRLGLVRAQRWSADPRCPHIYKLTARALRLLDHLHSNVRRSHTPETIRRKLLTVQFLCEHRDIRIRLALSFERKRAVLEAMGFLPELLPVIHRGGRPVSVCDEILGDDGQRILVYYIDRFTPSAETELRHLLELYARLIASGGACLRFIIVVASEDRERLYRALLDEAQRVHGVEIQVHRVDGGLGGFPRGAFVVNVVGNHVR